MKESDIAVGKLYTNGKGRIRRVIDRNKDGEYKLYNEQIDFDCVKYEIVKDGSKKKLSSGKTGVMTTKGFASWAKYEVNAKEE